MSKMTLLSASFEVRDFAPHQILTVAIPMTLVNEAAGESGQYTQEQTDAIIGKSLREAIEEYNKEVA